MVTNIFLIFLRLYLSTVKVHNHIQVIVHCTFVCIVLVFIPCQCLHMVRDCENETVFLLYLNPFMSFIWFSLCRPLRNPVPSVLHNFGFVLKALALGSDMIFYTFMALKWVFNLLQIQTKFKNLKFWSRKKLF
jgi:hypothetical protein